MSNYFIRNGKLYARRDGRGRFIAPQRVYTGDASAEDALAKRESWVAAGRPSGPAPRPRLASDEDVPLAHLSWEQWADPYWR